MSRAPGGLPPPLSPTSEKVSPRSIAKLTSSTAFKTRRPEPVRSRVTQGGETSKLRPSPSALRTVSVICYPGGGPIGDSLRMEPARRLGPARRQEPRPLDAAAVEHARASRIEGAAGRDG